MSRYLERADNVARFLYVNIHLLLDLQREAHSAQWKPLVITSGDEEDFARRYKQPTEDNVVRFLASDPANSNSILSCIQKARENARTVREIIPSDMWEMLNELYHYVQKQAGAGDIEKLQEFCARIRTRNHLFIGMYENVVTRNEGWHFARLGRMLERADKTARILDVKYFYLLPSPDAVDSPQDAVEWGAVLKSANAFEMYRKQFHRINYRDVTRFLIFENSFPRSILHSVNCATTSLEALMAGSPLKRHALGSLYGLQKRLVTLSIEDVLTGGLHEFIDDLQADLNRIDHEIFEAFFAHQKVG